MRGLEHSTLVGYQETYDKWFADLIGYQAPDRITPADLDHAFGRMRQAGLSHSRMNNARALLSGAYKWGRRHRKVTTNPVASFELPGSIRSRRAPSTPQFADPIRLLNGADERDPLLSPILKLAATTGMRRGELAGLRRNRLRLDRHELLVDTAVNDAGGTVVIKPTKTKQGRVVSFNPSAVSGRQGHTVQVMLQHYSSRRRSADQAAAEHLGRQVHGGVAQE